MTNSESILDQIISSKQAAIINEFNPKEIVETLINDLSSREKEVIILRHGLDMEGKKTLEKIGEQFKVTRERIRQIENSALKKIKNRTQSEDSLGSIEAVFIQTLENHGGIMPEDMLLEETLSLVGTTDENITYSHFILSKLLNDRLHFLVGSADYHPSWKLPSTSLDSFQNILVLLLETISELNEPITLTGILSRLEQNKSDHSLKEFFNEPTLNSTLRISKKVKQNPFNEWGLIHWNTITLKKISDKVYLILKKKDKPLHFTAIAQEINQTGFDQKKANAATIHNELILDDKYILVGRGVYALKEWGYKSGTVSEVITDILKNSPQPLTREGIINQVLEKRFVKKSTVILALMDKDKFIKTKEGYILK